VIVDVIGVRRDRCRRLKKWGSEVRAGSSEVHAKWRVCTGVVESGLAWSELGGA